jgi:uncharacterized phage protein (TIGR01671 family)
MREILFRGQTRRKGEKVWLDGSPVDSNWVYGGIFPNNNGGDFSLIYQQEPEIHKFPVYADTVGQYTGLTDKNGKKIFEGDIVKTKFGRLCLVKWRSTGCFCGIDLIPLETKSKAPTEWDLYCSENLEVVGNIHDNPELLEQEG